METHLSELLRAACDDPWSQAHLVDLPPGLEGRTDVVSMGSHDSLAASIGDRLSLAEAEAATLHEAGHWLEGHEVWGSDLRQQYLDARTFDEEHGARTRGPFEQAADRRALALLRDPAVSGMLESAADEVAALLVKDAEQYGPFG